MSMMEPVLGAQGTPKVETKPKFTLVGDVSQPLKTGEAFRMDFNSAQLWKKIQKRNLDRFNVITCMFALHYMYKDERTLDAFLRNVSDNLEDKGFFMGACFDGEAVLQLLANTPTGEYLSGLTSNGRVLWKLKKDVL